jgi:hypothetical protein
MSNAGFHSPLENVSRNYWNSPNHLLLRHMSLVMGPWERTRKKRRGYIILLNYHWDGTASLFPIGCINFTDLA